MIGIGLKEAGKGPYSAAVTTLKAYGYAQVASNPLAGPPPGLRHAVGLINLRRAIVRRR